MLIMMPPRLILMPTRTLPAEDKSEDDAIMRVRIYAARRGGSLKHKIRRLFAVTIALRVVDMAICADKHYAHTGTYRRLMSAMNHHASRAAPCQPPARAAALISPPPI